MQQRSSPPPELAIHGGQRSVPAELKTRWPLITQQDKERILATLDEEVLHGPYVPEVEALEKDFAAYIGVKYCIATNSGTAALHMAIAAAGIGPGDEVIVPSFTFIATAAAVLHHNAIPVFVDIDPRSFNIDPEKIEAKITTHTKAIIPVHIHGLPVDLTEIQRIAEKHNLVLIEDACQAAGALYQGRKVGQFGALAAFSLNVTKTLPGIEGGLLVTNDKRLRDEGNLLRMFGEEIRPDEMRSYDAYGMGWMYRTFGMPAALARSQLHRLDEYNQNAIKNAKRLSKNLSAIKGLKLPYVPEDRTPTFHKYRVRLDATALAIKGPVAAFRDKLMKTLQAEGVDVVQWQTLPVPGHAIFQLKRGYGKGCPWSCHLCGHDVDYSLDHYPETARLLDDSFVVCSEPYPICAQKPELMDRYGEAFAKVFDRLDWVTQVDLGDAGERNAQ